MDFVDDFEQDSGMESSPYSKDDTPERKSDDLVLDFEKYPLNLSETVHEISIDPPTPDATKTQSATVIENKPEEIETSPIFTLPTGTGTIERLNADKTESYDDEPDETIGERLWGLTEMFPECVLNTTHTAVSTSWSGIKSLYSFSRTVAWILASTSVILFAPVLFEVERAKMDELNKTQQKQFLLGPSAAMVGTGGGALPPPIPR